MNETVPSCDAERVERYVSGALAAAETTAFEEHLLVCEGCAELVLGLDRVRAGLHAGGMVNERRVSRQVLALAASVTLAVAAGSAGWWLFTRPANVLPATSQGVQTPAVPDPAPQADTGVRLAHLAAFEPPPYIDLATRSGADASRPFDQAMRLYNRGDYAGAAAGLRSVLQSEPGFTVARLFLGISLLVLDQPDEALPALEVVAGEASPYATLATLMAARAHLKLGDAAAARAALMRASAGDDPTASAEATTLLSRLPQQDEPRP